MYISRLAIVEYRKDTLIRWGWRCCFLISITEIAGSNISSIVELSQEELLESVKMDEVQITDDELHVLQMHLATVNEILVL